MLGLDPRQRTLVGRERHVVPLGHLCGHTHALEALGRQRRRLRPMAGLPLVASPPRTRRGGKTACACPPRLLGRTRHHRCRRRAVRHHLCLCLLSVDLPRVEVCPTGRGRTLAGVPNGHKLNYVANAISTVLRAKSQTTSGRTLNFSIYESPRTRQQPGRSRHPVKVQAERQRRWWEGDGNLPALR